MTPFCQFVLVICPILFENNLDAFDEHHYVVFQQMACFAITPLTCLGTKDVKEEV